MLDLEIMIKLPKISSTHPIMCHVHTDFGHLVQNPAFSETRLANLRTFRFSTRSGKYLERHQCLGTSYKRSIESLQYRILC